MSEEDQATAIGHAIQAAVSKNQLVILEAELDCAAESFRIAHEALRELLKGTDPKRHDIYKALKAIPDRNRLKDTITEYESVAARNAELAERAKQLNPLNF